MGCKLKKNLGVLEGVGCIGLEVIKVALDLGMKVKIFDMIPGDRKVASMPIVSKEEA